MNNFEVFQLIRFKTLAYLLCFSNFVYSSDLILFKQLLEIEEIVSDWIENSSIKLSNDFDSKPNLLNLRFRIQDLKFWIIEGSNLAEIHF